MRNFGNTSGMRVILFFENIQNLNEISKMQQKIEKYISNEGHLFLKNVQNLNDISKMQQKIEEKFFVFQILASEFVALYCLY